MKNQATIQKIAPSISVAYVENSVTYQRIALIVGPFVAKLVISLGISHRTALLSNAAHANDLDI